MADLKQFLMPDVGEGLTEAEIVKWDVGPGDTVKINQTLVEIETAKAAVELPSPYAGVVIELHAAPGDTIDVGRPIITIDTATSGSATPAVPATPAGGGRPTVLVGYGPKVDGPGRRRATKSPNGQLAAAVQPSAVQPLADEPAAGVPAQAVRALAKPPVRKLAKDLGIDIDTISPTGPDGSVSRADVEHAAAPAARPDAVGPVTRPPGIRETRVPIRGVRRQMAAAMVESATTVPHVSEFVTVDVTAMMELRTRIAARPEFVGVKVSPMLFLAKAVVLAAAVTPEMNSTWDDESGEIIVKHYVNLGIAAATPRGLVVPNIKDADQLSLRDLALALTELTETARAGHSTPADLAGGTITITNVGVFGVDSGTPILNPGEAGIVAFGTVSRRPWVVDEQIVPRWVTTLAISFDHRIVDGEQGSRFLMTVAGLLSDPGLALL